MSVESQTKFLTKLKKSIEKEGGFRRMTEKRSHNVTVELKSIHNAIKATVKDLMGEGTEREQRLVLAKMRTPARQYFNLVRAGLVDFTKKYADKKAGEQNHKIMVNTANKIQLIMQERKGSKGNLKNIFEAVYSIYARKNLNEAGQTPQTVLHEAMNKALLEVFEVRDLKTDKQEGNNPMQVGMKTSKGESIEKKIINIEHGNLIGVVETKIAEKIDQFVEEDSVRTRDDVLKFLKSQGVDMRIIRTHKDGEKGEFDEMEVFIGSQAINAEEGSSSKERKEDLLKILDNAIKELGKLDDVGPGLAFLKGSDSFADKKQKEAVNIVLKRFKKLKNVKTDALFKIKLGQTKASIKEKGSPPAAIVAKARSSRNRKLMVAKRTNATNAPLQMIVNFNKRLPAVVQKNMRPPALEYDTGRFAESVKVTDVTKTPKGFPSIGYTYDRDNYEQFEATSGSKQFASHDRDPRRLIDRSMREIAKELAIGRFFTRRV